MERLGQQESYNILEQGNIVVIAILPPEANTMIEYYISYGQRSLAWSAATPLKHLISTYAKHRHSLHFVLDRVLQIAANSRS